jgi:type IV secretion system protein VirB2
MSSHAPLRPAGPCFTTHRPHDHRRTGSRATTVAQFAGPDAAGQRLPASGSPKSPKPASRPGALAQLLAGGRFKAHVVLLLLLPSLVLAQSSPFQTGATALQTNLLTLLTPVAVILVIGLGVMAMANRIAWGWCIGAIVGIAVAFGAPQIVGWIRGMFGV